MVAYSGDPSTWKVETEGYGHPQIQGEFKDNLSYTRTYLNKDKTETGRRKEKKKEISHHVQIITTCCFSSTSDKTKKPFAFSSRFQESLFGLEPCILTTYLLCVARKHSSNMFFLAHHTSIYAQTTRTEPEQSPLLHSPAKSVISKD